MGDSRNSLAVVSQSPKEVPAVPIIVQDNSNLRRSDFPDGFVFGTGTSAYQAEGAAAVDGRGPSVWDDFALRTPGKITDGSNGNVSADMYHRYKEDIRTMKAMGFDGYRFSISWPRVLPGGRCSAGINRKAIDYYNDVIDTVLAHGMKPYVTLFHFDLPYCLEKEYDGFLSKKIVSDFLEFAELCFWEFGDRVKWWTTVNEPWTYAVSGYVRGNFPPGKASSPPERVLTKLQAYKSVQHPDATVPTTRSYSDVKYDKSDPAKDAYTVARNLLLAHAAAVHLYRTKFEVFQKGEIGIVLCSNWHEPLDESSKDDQDAVYRAIDFMLGWFLEPVLYGQYPKTMIEFVPPENLAPFTNIESQMLKGSVDYVGINYYTASYVINDPDASGVGYDADQKLQFKTERNGIPIGPPSGSSWLYIVPWGIYKHLVYIKKTYPDIPPIYITENGVSDENDYKLTAKEASVDPRRTKYHQDHLYYILKAINEEKVDVRGYFIWAWCDNFEWSEGYKVRFGITCIDYINNQTRYAKQSAVWFAEFLEGKKNIIPLLNKRQTEEDPENVPGKKRSRFA